MERKLVYGSAGTGQKMAGNSQRLLNDLAGDSRRAVLLDRNIAPSAMRENVRTSPWRFAEFRGRHLEGIRALAESFTHESLAARLACGRKLPLGLAVGVVRLAVAQYLLERMDEMREAALKIGNATAMSKFLVVRDCLLGMFDDGYFSKDSARLIRDYLGSEPALVSCAAACSVRLLPSLQDIVREHQTRIAAQVDGMNGTAKVPA
jgi:hypothetical protein